MSGLFIFLLVLAYFLIFWDSLSEHYISYTEARSNELDAITLADRLVMSGGQPLNWTQSPLSAKSIGLAKMPGELDSYRVDALSSLPYANAKYLLGLDGDFLIKIDAQDGAVLALIGQQPGNTTRAIEVTRVALYNGNMVNVRVQLYEN